MYWYRSVPVFLETDRFSWKCECGGVSLCVRYMCVCVCACEWEGENGFHETVYSWLIRVQEFCITFPVQNMNRLYFVLEVWDCCQHCFSVHLCCRPHHQSVGPGDREGVAVTGRPPQHRAEGQVLSHYAHGLHCVPIVHQGLGHQGQPRRLSQNTQVLVGLGQHLCISDEKPVDFWWNTSVSEHSGIGWSGSTPVCFWWNTCGFLMKHLWISDETPFFLMKHIHLRTLRYWLVSALPAYFWRSTTISEHLGAGWLVLVNTCIFLKQHLWISDETPVDFWWNICGFLMKHICLRTVKYWLVSVNTCVHLTKRICLGPLRCGLVSVSTCLFLTKRVCLGPLRCGLVSVSTCVFLTKMYLSWNTQVLVHIITSFCLTVHICVKPAIKHLDADTCQAVCACLTALPR